jgi:hypothetical protein
MNRDQVQTVKQWGLLANGASGAWSIDLDEACDGDEWNMQIDGPQMYLRFAPPDLQVISSLLTYLRNGLHAGQSNGRTEGRTDAIVLGRLGSMFVSIIQDDEFATRWFIIIDGEADAVVRFTLDAADVEMLVEALRQVMEDLQD